MQSEALLKLHLLFIAAGMERDFYEWVDKYVVEVGHQYTLTRRSLDEARASLDDLKGHYDKKVYHELGNEIAPYTTAEEQIGPMGLTKRFRLLVLK